MIRFIVCSFLVTLGVVGCTDPTGPDMHVTLQIDGDAYRVGEAAQLELVNHHTPSSRMVWYWPCRQVNVERQDGDGWEQIGVIGDRCDFSYSRLQPGDSREWSFTIDRYHLRGDGEASFEPGRTYRFLHGVRYRPQGGAAIIYSRPFVVQD